MHIIKGFLRISYQIPTLLIHGKHLCGEKVTKHFRNEITQYESESTLSVCVVADGRLITFNVVERARRKSPRQRMSLQRECCEEYLRHPHLFVCLC